MLLILSFLALFTSSLAFHPTTVLNHALVGHVYRSLQDLDWLDCIQSCHDDPNCFSYNFVRSTHGFGVCQMIDCGLEELCNTESRLVFSTGTIFQQIASTGGTGICEPSSNTHDSKSDFSLLFPSPPSVANYVAGYRGKVELSKLSVCFWMKSVTSHMTVFSYMGTRGTKELMLEIYDKNYVKFTVGEEPRSIHVQVNDGKWHHICVLWDAADGQSALFKDGLVAFSQTDFKDDYVILPGGTLVLGQEQEDLQRFDSSRSFVGELADFHLWRHYMTAIEVSRMSKSCVNRKGDVFQWSKFSLGIKGKVQIVRPSSCTP